MINSIHIKLILLFQYRKSTGKLKELKKTQNRTDNMLKLVMVPYKDYNWLSLDECLH